MGYSAGRTLSFHSHLRTPACPRISTTGRPFQNLAPQDRFLGLTRELRTDATVSGQFNLARRSAHDEGWDALLTADPVLVSSDRRVVI